VGIGQSLAFCVPRLVELIRGIDNVLATLTVRFHAALIDVGERGAQSIKRGYEVAPLKTDYFIFTLKIIWHFGYLSLVD